MQIFPLKSTKIDLRNAILVASVNHNNINEQIVHYQGLQGDTHPTKLDQYHPISQENGPHSRMQCHLDR
jgi:hypothetical protein